ADLLADHQERRAEQRGMRVPISVGVLACQLGERRPAGNLGWAEPVSQYEALATAVRILAEGPSTFCERMDEATFALTRWQAEDFPKRIRERVRNALSVRCTVGLDYTGGCVFQFGHLAPKRHYPRPQS